MSDELPLKVVGMGPFPMPGEKRRWRRAHDEARRLMQLVDEIEQRGEDDDDPEETR